MYVNENQAEINVSIGLTTPLKKYGDNWKTAEGGNLTTDDVKTRPGGMGKEVSVGTMPTREDLTVTTQFTDAFVAALMEMESLVGYGRVEVGLAWLKPDGVTKIGTSTIRRGTLKSVAAPNAGGDDVGMITIVVSCDQLAA